MLCGVTGTEFLTVTVGATPDMLEFVPAQPACRIAPAQDSPTSPAFLDATATTSWAQLIVQRGQLCLAAGARTAVQAERPTRRQCLPAPRLPPASPSMSSTISRSRRGARDKEQRASHTARALCGARFRDRSEPRCGRLSRHGIAGAQSQARRQLHVRRRSSDARQTPPSRRPPPTLAMTPQGMLAELAGTPLAWTALQMATSAAGILEFDAMGPSICKAVQQNQIFTVISDNPATTIRSAPGSPLFDFQQRQARDRRLDLRPVAGRPRRAGRHAADLHDEVLSGRDDRGAGRRHTAVVAARHVQQDIHGRRQRRPICRR